MVLILAACSQREAVRPRLPSQATPTAAPIVITDQGAVQGVVADATYAFKGIPYAAPPVGPLRFRPPQPATPWQGVRDATQFGPLCPQLNSNDQVEGDEDCLTLNIWTPATPPGAPLPVMVFIHGGGNVQGASSLFLYDGQYLVEHGGVIVVSINYRLGPLGYLTHSALAAESERHISGNYGILDQIAALQWVQRNILAFGGDVAKIMIFGESAGAVNVCTLVASPLARGLFSRALMQSGGCNQRRMDQAEPFGQQVVAAAGCGTAVDIAACLRGLSVSSLLTALPTDPHVAEGMAEYGPTVDGYVLTGSPIQVIRDGAHNRVPFAVGANADETAMFVPTILTEAGYRQRVYATFGLVVGALILDQYPASEYETPTKAYIALTTDARFVCPSRSIARAADLGQDEPVYRYFFTHALDSTRAREYGAYHALELFFVFHTLTQVPGFTPSARELALSEAMVGYWTRFAATGDPNGDNAPVWPMYDRRADAHLILDTPIASGDGVRTARCDFWDSLTRTPDYKTWLPHIIGPER